MFRAPSVAAAVALVAFNLSACGSLAAGRGGGAAPSESPTAEPAPSPAEAAPPEDSSALAPARTPPPGAPGALNAKFRDPELDATKWQMRWEAHDREVYREKDALLDALAPMPGEHIGDLGAGTGAFTFPMAERVGATGRVVAMDIAPAFVAAIRQRASAGGVAQVQAVISADASLPLPDSSLDALFLCDVYHHFEQPGPMLAEMYRVLKPGGRLLVVDFHRIEGVTRPWLMDHVRAGHDIVHREIQDAGFRVQAVASPVPGLEENWIELYRRP